MLGIFLIKMVGVNELYMKIVKRIFKANNGRQLAIVRKKLEVLEFLQSGEIPNETQQKHIDEVNEEYSFYDNQIHKFLETIPLKDMTDPVEEPEEPL